MNLILLLPVERRSCAPLICVLALLVTSPASAQSAAPDATGVPPPAAVAGAPAAAALGPILTRDDNGKVFVRATRVTRPMKMDAKLDEEIYGEVAPITEADFLQQEPNPGALLTEKTE